MELCSENHGEVCYEGRKCPACELVAEKEGVEGELEQVKTLREADAEVISELRSEIEDLKSAALENSGGPAN